MNVDAMLCDAATVREGLLNVLGAGITRLQRDQFPAAMGTQMALLLHATAQEMVNPHKLMISITHETGEKVAEFGVDFSVAANPGQPPNEIITVPLVANFQNQGLPQPGAYDIVLMIDGKHSRTLQFHVTMAGRPQAAVSAKG